MALMKALVLMSVALVMMELVVFLVSASEVVLVLVS
jgi:hypothetical protein